MSGTDIPDLQSGATCAFADRAIDNLQQWLVGTYHGVSKGGCRSTWMSSSFGTIVGVNRWLPFRRRLVLGRHAPKLLIRRYEMEFTTTR